MITVACVYKTHPENGLSPDYVHRLKAQVAEHTTRDYRFVCLTDVPDEVECDTIPLEWNMNKQWSKLELFRHDYGGRVVYIDIDTMILKNIDALLDYDKPVGMARDWYRDRFNSAIMVWNESLECILPDEKKRAQLNEGPMWGDQMYIQRYLEHNGYDIGRLHPHVLNILSYRFHCRKRHIAPPEADIISFHGVPRPHQIGWELVHGTVEDEDNNASS